MFEPGELRFSRLPVHSGQYRDVLLSNVGRGDIQLLEAWTEGPAGTYLADFIEPGPWSLISGGGTTVRVTYLPREAGAHDGTLVLRTDSADEPFVRIPLSGEALGVSVGADDNRIDFGRIELQSHKTRTLTLQNRSEIPIEVNPAIIGQDKDEFEMEGATLTPGEIRTFELTFRPVRPGQKLAMLTFAPCVGCPDQLIELDAVGLDRAVVAEPELVDFGQVPVDRDVVKKVRFHNLSTEPFTLTRSGFVGQADPSFTLESAAFPIVLSGDESREFEVTYSPSHMGRADAVVEVEVTSIRNPTTEAKVTAFGGSAELCVSPPVFDFGGQPVGSKTPATIVLRNCGSSNGAPLEIQNLFVGNRDGSPNAGDDQFTFESVALPTTLQAGEELSVKIYFEPSRVGPHSASFSVVSTAFGAEEASVSLSGNAQSHLPCTLKLSPDKLDFGNVPPGRGAVLGVKVENAGVDVCAVKNIRLANDSGGVFKMPGGALPGVVMQPGAWFSFQVAFVAPATAAGDYQGSVQIEPSDPANPVVLVPLTAHSQTTCLVLSPRYLDFGFGRPDCPPGPMTVNVLNACSQDFTVQKIEIGAGTSDGEFVIEDAPSAPFALASGDSFSVDVRYLAQAPGMNLSPLFITTTEMSKPQLVPLVGESNPRATATERFVQQDGAKADVLFVVDNTASMVEEQPRFIAALPAFVDAAKAKNVDLRVAVTTTGMEPASASCPGGANGGEAGRFFPADNSNGRIFTAATPNLAGELQQNADVGRCAFVEQGFEAMRRALSSPLVDRADDPRTSLPNDGNAGFLRDSAGLAVVFVGDEDDHSPDDVQSYVDFLRTRKGVGQPQRSLIFAIAPTEAACSSAGGSGTRYAEAAKKTGGEVLSVCASDYGPLLANVASKAFSPQTRFPLSGAPDPASIEVTVDGSPASGWSYVPSSNSVQFSTAPAAGAQIQVKYRKVCVND